MKQPKFRVSVKNRNEFNDYDYLHKLDNQEWDWLRRFNREYLNADFQFNGESIHPKEMRKDCYNMNNCRNRDLYAIAKVTGNLFPVKSYGKEKKKTTIDILDLHILDIKGGFVNIIEDFRRNKPDIIKHVTKNGIEDISGYAAMGAVPLYAIWTYIGEDFPEHIEEVQRQKAILKDFYGYKED